MRNVKKIQKIMGYVAMVFTIIWFVPSLYAKVYEARSDNKFYNRLMKKPLAVALFYKEDKELKKDKEFKQKLKLLEKMFSAIGKQDYYKEGGVSFIKANTRYDTIDELAQGFFIANLPAFLLFKNGVQLKDEKNKPVMLIGWTTYDQLEDFIRDHLEKDIENNIKRRAEQLRRLREAERLSYLWYRPYLYWGWPYGGWGPGWGWRGGWGWRYGRCCW
jgi:hypothetical protein